VSLPGDPASVSALAADVARAAAEVDGARQRLVAVAAVVAGVPGADRDVPGRMSAGARALAVVEEALRDCASALQTYAADLQQARALDLLAGDTGARGADVPGLRVSAGEVAWDAAWRLGARVAAPLAALTEPNGR
jgi:hypothetical protein